jgi:hypothetical protein
MNIQTALVQLEIKPEEFNPPHHMPPNVMQAYLNDFKETIKKQRKSLAKQYHPDVCTDDNSLEKMKMINEAADFLEKQLDINQRPSPMQIHPGMFHPGMFQQGTFNPGIFKQTIIIQHGDGRTTTQQSSNGFSFSFSF